MKELHPIQKTYDYEGVSPAEINVKKLREILKKNGVFLPF